LHAGGVITREGRGGSEITGRAAGAGAGAGAVAAAGYPVTFSVDLTAPRRGSVCRVLNRSSCSGSGSGFDSDFHSTPAQLRLTCPWALSSMSAALTTTAQGKIERFDKCICIALERTTRNKLWLKNKHSFSSWNLY